MRMFVLVNSEIRTLTIIIVLLSRVFLVSAQEYFMGSLREDAAYERIPRVAPLLTRDYRILPTSHSLRQYCPTPGDQSTFGTCVGWSVAYHARTIAEAVAYGWTDAATVNAETFSPLFLYLQIKFSNDNNCSMGAYISRALDVSKNTGIPKYRDFNPKCATSFPSSLLQPARNYRIDDYRTLFGLRATQAEKINRVKKSLSENKPVVISMKCYRSFNNAKDRWCGTADSFLGYHAMVVVGYCNEKYGGAFELLNSWGTRWGNGGYTWVTYSDFANNVDYSYEIFVRSKIDPPTPDPVRPDPVPEPDRLVNLAGSVRLELSTGQEMPAALFSTFSASYYRLENKYIAGTRFRVFISNNEPAYVYAIGSDQTNNPVVLFPQSGISALMPYRQNNIAIPGEHSLMQLDVSAGSETDFLLILYSHDELSVNEVVNAIKNGTGNFANRIAIALGEKMVPAREATYERNAMRFRVRNTERSVVPVIIEINRR